MARSVFRQAALALVLAMGGCDSAAAPDAGSGPTDAGAIDGGGTDGGDPAADAGAEDGGRVDAAVDAGPAALRLVEGYVYGAPSFAPLEGALVEGGGSSALTDESGHFALATSVATGVLTITAPGFTLGHAELAAGPEPAFVEVFLAVPSTSGMVMGDAGGTVSTPVFTAIVPPMAFVDEAGAPVTGMVEIAVTELDPTRPETAAAVPAFVEGEEVAPIPFEPAGVFDISASSAGRLVQVAEGVSIDLEMVAADASPSASQEVLRFDPERAAWVPETTALLATDESGAAIYRMGLSHFSWRCRHHHHHSPTYAQSLCARGRVTQDGLPVERASVSLSLGGTAITAIDGSFEVRSDFRTSYPTSEYRPLLRAVHPSGSAALTVRLRHGECVDVGTIALPARPVECPPGHTACAGVCRDLTRDPAACGSCATACAVAAQQCEAGTCTCGEDTLCTVSGAPACVDTGSHVEHCGACGNACGSDEQCVAGTCEPIVCPAGLSPCDRICRALGSDLAHCGACDNACPERNECVAGTCTLITVCGDARVEGEEACDDGVNDGAYGGCEPGCAALARRCGDGVVQAADGETCEGTDCPASCTSADACHPAALIGAGASCDARCEVTVIAAPAEGDGCCPPGADANADGDCPAICGNGATEPGEMCDDGNTAGADGCNAACTSDESCGNGFVDPAEACDDGNMLSADGCNAACTSDESCGNAFLDPAEACDDGNTVSADGCSGACTSDETCGNAFVDPSESCDDGNTASGDGCNADCTSDESCGNAFVDPSEACDDGNTVSADGCNADCTSDESCGNAFLDPEEVCDDGNTAADDGCNATCSSDESCGNGVLDGGEACDDGNTETRDGCSFDCVIEGCGNGRIDDPTFEMCDDGNTVSWDGCSADCSSTEVCGNGRLDEPVEVCEDANTSDGDGCSADCTSDETCGNGIIDTAAGEVCDDANVLSGDGCSATCESNETCGNAFLDLTEICDDGNTTPGDGCNAECSSNETCGNAFLDPLEACDDGNVVSLDGCNAACTSDETCGNAFVDPSEACDDGNTTAGDGCNAACTSDETCGNAVLDADAGEVCDDGDVVGGDGCAADCRSDESCGNGVLDALAGEVCDDANTTSGDGCNAACTSDESCGNGFVDVPEGEACDDGNTVSGDGCSGDCAAIECLGVALTAPDVTTANSLGGALAMDRAGDRFVVGAIQDSVAGLNAGAAFVFRLEPGGWVLEQELRSPFPQAHAYFGRAVAIDGDTLAIGADGEDGASADEGRVYVYVRSGTTWTLEQQVLDSPVSGSAQFGKLLALEGDTLLASRSSRIQVYQRAGSTWTHDHVVDVPHTTFHLRGDRLIVGDQNEMETWIVGRVDVYTRSTGDFAWVQTIANTWAVDFTNYAFGASVTDDGARMAAGDPTRGEVRTYTWDGARFVFEQLLTHPGGGTNNFGSSVSLSTAGDRLAVSARATGNGRVFVFERSGGVWTMTDDLRAGAAGAGSAVLSPSAVVGDQVIGGAWLATPGRVVAFDLSACP